MKQFAENQVRNHSPGMSSHFIDFKIDLMDFVIQVQAWLILVCCMESTLIANLTAWGNRLSITLGSRNSLRPSSPFSSPKTSRWHDAALCADFPCESNLLKAYCSIGLNVTRLNPSTGRLPGGCVQKATNPPGAGRPLPALDMVNVAGRSRGCAICRTRKIKVPMKCVSQ